MEIFRLINLDMKLSLHYHLSSSRRFRSIGTFAPHNRCVQVLILAAVFEITSTIISFYKKKTLFNDQMYTLFQVGLIITMPTNPINKDFNVLKPECPS
ncbi:unnamed protein product [Caenorhabditis nigoni]